MSAQCGECFDGKIIDEIHEDYEKLDQELIRLIDSGQFTYEAAFKRASRLYPAVKNCPDCDGGRKKRDEEADMQNNY